MIRVFSQTDKTFNSNGDIVLQPIKAKVHKEDNGDYYLDLETNLSYVDYFVEGNIVVANTPTGDQAFRVGNVTKTQNKLVSKCWHVFYDSENYLIADSNVVNKDCNDALNHLNNATEPVSEFTVSSDVATVDSFRCVRKSLYEAIQTVLERWGGHLVRDNFGISILSSIGQDNGIIVQYKKNLKEITCQENWDEVVTKILPVGRDGILLNDLDPTQSIYIESSVQYSLPYTKTVSFSQDDIDEDEYETETAYKEALIADLRAQATEYLRQNCVPQVNYTLKANLDRVTDVGDIIQVIDDRLSVNMTTNVIGFDYDCISEKYTEVIFGNFAQSISGLVSKITSGIDKTVSDQISQATSIVDNQIGERVANPAKRAYAVGEYVIFNGTFCKVISPIAEGGIFSIGTNLSASTVGDELEKFKNDAVTQTNTIDSADYRLLLSNSANDATETAGARKSTNFKANPSTGELSALKISGDTADSTVGSLTTSSASYPEISAGETHKVLFGKIKKYLADLKANMGGGHTILNSSGTAMTDRANLQFVGMNVTDDSTNDKTVVTAEVTTQDLDLKADKVTNATNGNLAGLNASGNLTDSGKKASDFATKVSNATSGHLAGLDANGNLTDSGKSASDFATVNGHSILNASGSAMTQRANLQFDGLGVTDDSANGKTIVKNPVFNGTTAEWTALSSAEKAKYTIVNLTDDYGNGYFIDESIFSGYANFTKPSPYNNRFNTANLSGGYKIVGNLVYVYMIFATVNISGSTDDYWGLSLTMPKPKIANNPLTGFSYGGGFYNFAVMDLGVANGYLYIRGNPANYNSQSAYHSITIKGVYEKA